MRLKAKTIESRPICHVDAPERLATRKTGENFARKLSAGVAVSVPCVANQYAPK